MGRALKEQREMRKSCQPGHTGQEKLKTSEAKAHTGGSKKSKAGTFGRTQRRTRTGSCPGKAGDKWERQGEEKEKHLGFGGVDLAEEGHWHLIGFPTPHNPNGAQTKQVLPTGSSSLCISSILTCEVHRLLPDSQCCPPSHICTA